MDRVSVGKVSPGRSRGLGMGRHSGAEDAPERVTALVRSGSDSNLQTTCLSAWSPGAVQRAVEALSRGELVAFPTDTVYGVGAHAFLPESVAQLYAVKDRPSHLAIPLLLPDIGALGEVCTEIPPHGWRIAEHFWPGALSLVLRRSPVVPEAVTGGGPTVAVRVPDHALVRDLCRGLGAPLAATSANHHGDPPPITASQVQAALGGRVSVILDGGPSPGGEASTVLDLTRSPAVVLRRGPVTAEQLAAFVLLATD